MKTKSVSSCLLGIILSVIGAACAYAFDVIFLFLVFVIKHNYFIMLIPYIHIGAYVIAFIGSIISLFNTKISGITMILSSIININLLIALCIWIKQFHILILLFWLPTLLILIVGIKTLNKHKKS